MTVDAGLKLLGIDEHPEHSAVGLAITALSLVVMPTLAWAKRRVAAGLGSVALKADAAETQLCTYLSAVVLVGLAANSLAGWWWMDPLAGLVVAVLAHPRGPGRLGAAASSATAARLPPHRSCPGKCQREREA